MTNSKRWRKKKREIGRGNWGKERMMSRRKESQDGSAQTNCFLPDRQVFWISVHERCCLIRQLKNHIQTISKISFDNNICTLTLLLGFDQTLKQYFYVLPVRKQEYGIVMIFV